MATALTLSGPVGYKGGSSQSSGPFVGYGSGMNYVMRYSFKTPSDAYVTSVTFKTTFRTYSGATSIGSSYPIRVKISDSSTAYKNAGSGSSYDKTFTGSGSVTISGLKLAPGTTYYIWLFPGFSSGYSLSYCYDNSGNDYASATCETSPLGQGYVGDGSTSNAHEVYIGNGTSWVQYIPYIGTGSGWEQCS